MLAPTLEFALDRLRCRTRTSANFSFRNWLSFDVAMQSHYFIFLRLEELESISDRIELSFTMISIRLQDRIRNIFAIRQLSCVYHNRSKTTRRQNAILPHI